MSRQCNRASLSLIAMVWHYSETKSNILPVVARDRYKAGNVFKHTEDEGWSHHVPNNLTVGTVWSCATQVIFLSFVFVFIFNEILFKLMRNVHFYSWILSLRQIKKVRNVYQELKRALYRVEISSSLFGFSFEKLKAKMIVLSYKMFSFSFF